MVALSRQAFGKLPAITAIFLLGLALACAFASAAPAAVKLSVVKSKPFAISAGNEEARFTGDGYEWIECRGSDRALTIGWTDVKAPMALLYANTWNSDGNLGLGPTRPAKSAKMRGVVVCAKGAFQGTVKEKAGTVKCSRRQLALGIPVVGGPLLSSPVVSRPSGKSAWTTTGQGSYGDATAICVAASAFKQVKLVKRKASFRSGSATAVVKASCARGTRPISWGYEAGTLPDNEFRRPGGSEGMTVPYVASSLPSGSAGWALTFRTPDGAGALGSTSLTLHLVCAKPA